MHGDQGLCPTRKVFHRELTDGHFARNAHELFLALQQAQAQALLGVFNIALDSLLLAVNFFQSQVNKRGDDGGQKKEHGGKWCNHGKPVLPLWGQA